MAPAITPSGDDSVGVLAQSIGGGGGNGGSSFSGSFSGSGAKNVAVAVGGSGGAGGDGRVVNVVNNGGIETSGKHSRAVFAQSIGGGGGNGGWSAAVDLTLAATNSKSVQVAVSVGGSGGSGGSGGDVSVLGNGSVLTLGEDSEGVFAQSIGGGGGNGGASLAATGVLGAHQGTNLALSVSIGGSGGDGNRGGVVKVDRRGEIETRGDGSHAIFAQSIGGGGGTGGGARSVNLFLKAPGASKATNSENKSVELTMGGTGGSGGVGGSVGVTNIGNITTLGGDAHGIFAQSIGGGGGTGGNGHTGLNNLEFPSSLLVKAIESKSKSLEVALGGDGGTGNHGGNVRVNQTGNISTLSAGSYGILAQSVGAGGGVGGNGVVGLTGRIGIGGKGNAAGNGGDVEVTLAGQVDTSGAGAFGIFAQSVGGGGGVAGSLGNDLPGFESGNFAGSVGGAGSAGEVIVRHTGNITTTNISAHGIYTQSAGGSNGFGGDVEVVLDGEIAATGADSDGIFAQSRGDTGNGNIAVTVLGGQVRGGSGMGAGVRFVEGANNTLINHGAIFSQSGTAIIGTSGNETIHNYGTVTGSVDLGAGQNVFNNYLGAMLSPGVMGTMILGAGNALINYGLLTGSGQIIGDVVNAGTISPGNSAGSLTIAGNLNLSASANMTFEIGGLQQGTSYDFMQVTNFAQFAGTLNLSLINSFVPTSIDLFTLMVFSSSSEFFSNALNGGRLMTLDLRGSFQVSYTPTSLQVGDFQPLDMELKASLQRHASGNMILQFPGVSGYPYAVEYTTNLTSGAWTVVPSPVFTFPAPALVQWIDDGTQTGGLGGSSRFYRVKQ